MYIWIHKHVHMYIGMYVHYVYIHMYLCDIYIGICVYYIYIFGPVKPELGVIPSGQEGIQAWIFKIFLVKSSMYQ